jgi:putative oxidoreductase
MTASLSLPQIPASHRSRAADVTLWIVQIALAAMFLMAGTAKLFGTMPMVALFDAVGVGQWFRYATGLIEVGSAIALLIPRATVFGALVLVPTMAGAILTQLFDVHASPVAPAILMGGAVLVLAARRRELGSVLPTAR